MKNREKIKEIYRLGGVPVKNYKLGMFVKLEKVLVV